MNSMRIKMILFRRRVGPSLTSSIMYDTFLFECPVQKGKRTLLAAIFKLPPKTIR